MKHTPGPWYPHNERKAEQYPLWTVWPKEGSGHARICTVVQCDQDEANARLIAAAPELLAEAKELLRKATYADGYGTVLTQDLEALETAIAKAEGK